MRKRVILESPWKGGTSRNREYAMACLLDSLQRGEAPIASHLLYTEVLDDEDPDDRQEGMEAGWAWMPVAEAVVAYVDHGVSDGMRKGIDRAAEAGIPVQFRRIQVRRGLREVSNLPIEECPGCSSENQEIRFVSPETMQVSCENCGMKGPIDILPFGVKRWNYISKKFRRR